VGSTEAETATAQVECCSYVDLGAAFYIRRRAFVRGFVVVDAGHTATLSSEHFE
jgi:hypothetical protein